jgi:hypothetical protein
MNMYLNEYSQSKNEPQGSSSPEVLLRFVELIPAYDLQRMSEAIRSGSERVDYNEW